MVSVCVPHDQRRGRIASRDCIRDDFQYDATSCGAGKASMPKDATRPVVTRVVDDGVTILFTNERTGPVDLSIFDLRGRLVRRLAAQNFPAGAHALHWDGRNAQGQMVASGVYLVRVVMDGKAHASKAVLMR
jgi:flagellar hook assembly protein FlgD